MKKHKFKAGDVVYSARQVFEGRLAVKITKSIVKVVDADNGYSVKGGYLVKRVGIRNSWYAKEEWLHPTPEACAQALVEEFYQNNPRS